LPLNPVFDRAASPDAIAAALEEVGYAIVERVAGPDFMDRVDAEFSPYLDAVELSTTEFYGYKNKRIYNLIAKSRAAQELAIHPLVLAVCDRVLLPYCLRYHLHVTGLFELQPGEAAQALHRDGSIYPVQLPSIPTTLATFWACTDFTAENGGTNLVPGSHRWPADREPQPDEVVPAVMPRGSVLFYTSNLMHGAGANRANVVRRGLALHYNLGWLRQEENQFLSLPPDKARELPEAVQRLIGYDFGGPYLGFVESGHPQTLLRDDLPAGMARSNPEFEERQKAMKRLTLSAE